MTEDTTSVFCAREDSSEAEYLRMAQLQRLPFLLVKYTCLQLGTNVQAADLGVVNAYTTKKL